MGLGVFGHCNMASYHPEIDDAICIRQAVYVCKQECICARVFMRVLYARSVGMVASTSGRFHAWEKWQIGHHPILSHTLNHCRTSSLANAHGGMRSATHPRKLQLRQKCYNTNNAKPQHQMRQHSHAYPRLFEQQRKMHTGPMAVALSSRRSRCPWLHTSHPLSSN